jgi:hypothetical protein
MIALEHIASDMCACEAIEESKDLFLWACEDGIYDGWAMYSAKFFDRHNPELPAHVKNQSFPDVLLVALLRGYVLEEHYNRGTAPRFDSQKLTDTILAVKDVPDNQKTTAIEYCRRFIDCYARLS